MNLFERVDDEPPEDDGAGWVGGFASRMMNFCGGGAGIMVGNSGGCLGITFGVRLR